MSTIYGLIVLLFFICSHVFAMAGKFVHFSMNVQYKY